MEQEETAEPRPRFERQVYTLDEKTWHWLVRENVPELTRRPHTASGSKPTREEAVQATVDWMNSVLRVETLQQVRERTPWEAIGG